MSMKKYILPIVSLLFLFSCKIRAPKDIRIEEVNDYLCIENDKSSQSDIVEIIEYNYVDDSKIIEKLTLAEDILSKVSFLDKLLLDFKKLYSDDTTRIWLKTILEHHKEEYDSICKLREVVSNLYLRLYMMDIDSKKDSTMSVTYSKNDSVYIGIFCFDLDDKISSTKILNKATYTQLKNILDKSKNNSSVSLPSFEGIGLDIVPIDEDPTMTKEERDSLKKEARQRQIEKERKEKEARDAIRQEELQKKLEKERKEREIAEKKRLKQYESDINRILKDYVFVANLQSATSVDLATVFDRASFNGRTLSKYYVFAASKNEYTSSQWKTVLSARTEKIIIPECADMVSIIVEQTNASRSDIIQAMKNMGIKWKYYFRDYNERPLPAVIVTPDDL